MPITYSYPATVDVEFWYNNGNGWKLARTARYSATSERSYTNERVSLTVDGMGVVTGADFGMDHVLVQGDAEVLPLRVEWLQLTTTAPTPYSATPSGSAPIPFIAVAGT